MEYTHVVTSFLLADKKILLLRRSMKVGSYGGRWAAVSGYLEGTEAPLQRALTEIREEVSLKPEQITLVRAGETLRALDEQRNIVWIVHPFLFETRSKTIQLDWENTEYRWLEPRDLNSYETVPKLKETFDRVRCDLQMPPTALANVLQDVDKVAQDRVHGASILGRRGIELLAAAAAASQATTTEEMFCDLFLVAAKLQKAQLGMAIVRNLVRRLLYQIDRNRRSAASVEEFRRIVTTLAENELARAKDASEYASKNAASILPNNGRVLTHSYSSTVMKALELGMRSGRRLHVYTTESYPGMEGRQIAKDLVALGIPVQLIADSLASSIISDVDLVLVGADSVLADGSLVHKVKTKSIAAAAYEHGIHLYSACELTKFNVADFLGEPVETSCDLFDVTPKEHISKFITETGPVEPGEVENWIRQMLTEMYP